MDLSEPSWGGAVGGGDTGVTLDERSLSQTPCHIGGAGSDRVVCDGTQIGGCRPGRANDRGGLGERRRVEARAIVERHAVSTTIHCEHLCTHLLTRSCANARLPGTLDSLSQAPGPDKTINRHD